MALGDRDYMRNGPGGQFTLSWEWLDPVNAMLMLNIAVFVVQHVFGQAVTSYHEPYGILSTNALLEGRVWTIFTHMFVHENVLHLLCNMLMLFMAGKSLQSIIGGKKFLYVYFLSGVAGWLFEMTSFWLTGKLHHFGPTYMSEFNMFGASACVCGVIVAMAALLPREEITAMLYFIIPVKLRMWTLAQVIMGLSTILGLINIIWPPTGQTVTVAHFAHLGGALAGWWFVRMLGYSGNPASFEQLRRERQDQERSRELASVSRKKKRVVDVSDPDRMLVPPSNSKEFIEREINPILEKIHAHGMESLTKEERQVLERGSKEMSNRRDRKDH